MENLEICQFGTQIDDQRWAMKTTLSYFHSIKEQLVFAKAFSEKNHISFDEYEGIFFLQLDESCEVETSINHFRTLMRSFVKEAKLREFKK